MRLVTLQCQQKSLPTAGSEPSTFGFIGLATNFWKIKNYGVVLNLILRADSVDKCYVNMLWENLDELLAYKLKIIFGMTKNSKIAGFLAITLPKVIKNCSNLVIMHNFWSSIEWYIISSLGRAVENGGADRVARAARADFFFNSE